MAKWRHFSSIWKIDKTPSTWMIADKNEMKMISYTEQYMAKWRHFSSIWKIDKTPSTWTIADEKKNVSNIFSKTTFIYQISKSVTDTLACCRVSSGLYLRVLNTNVWTFLIWHVSGLEHVHVTWVIRWRQQYETNDMLSMLKRELRRLAIVKSRFTNL